MYVLNFCDVYELCKKHHWFTKGTAEQYNKMFRMIEEKAPIEELATVIWLCTDEKMWCRRDIFIELQKVSKAASANEC